MYITNISSSDGFGSQFHNIISYILIADVEGYQFIYTPMVSIEHNYNNDSDFIDRMEKLMNIKFFFPINDGTYHLNIFIDDVKRRYIDRDIHKFANAQSLQKIKDIFWKDKNRDHYRNGSTNVAVHIRRPNLHDNRTYGTDIPNQQYLNVIDKIRETLMAKPSGLVPRGEISTSDYSNQLSNLVPKGNILIQPQELVPKENKNILFHIYSQGDIDNFIDFFSEDTILHLDESIENSFIGLVASDILVTSVSAFSYTAALLHDGVVYYMPFVHEPIAEWIHF